MSLPLPSVPLLEAEGLQAEYRDAPVLWDLSLTVRPGEIVALVGSNGAGKSTLLRVLSGLREGYLEVKRGSIRFAGRSLVGLDPAEIVALGIAQVPEGRHLFPGLTVLENLQLGAYARRDAAVAPDLERVYDLFPRLAERRRQPAGTLSGGEQQMLAIGRALMSRPRLLLLDEPSMGLAPLLVQKIFDVIRRISREGVTLLLVEQNARLALAISDRGYVMESGRVTLADDAKALLANPDVQRAYLGG